MPKENIKLSHIKDNHKHFYAYVHKQRKQRADVLPIIDPVTCICISDPIVATKLLADHNESVLTKPTVVLFLDEGVPLPSFSNVDITWDSIHSNSGKVKKN